MNMLNIFSSERLDLINISYNKNAWPRNKYKSDAFYQYALSNHCLPVHMMHEQYFAYTCYHKKTGEFVGYVQGYLPSIKKSIWIQTFLIDQKFLRQGYGSEFYEIILKALNPQMTMTKVFLACFEANTSGRGFWGKLHFKKVLETTKNVPFHKQLSTILIFEREIMQVQKKEFFYEQENIKNAGIQ